STIHCPSVMTLILIFFSVSETFTVSVKSPVSVQRGHTAILPCWLTSSQNAEDMEVRWYQGSDEYDTPALLYKEKAFDYSSQKASFAGRVSFGLKEETSGGLQAGDVSLKLEKATIEDIGTYTCYVSSSVAYSSASVTVMKDDNKVNLSCQSDGWYPKPELSWSDNKTALTPANVMFSRISAGFYSVHSWVLIMLKLLYALYNTTKICISNRVLGAACVNIIKTFIIQNHIFKIFSFLTFLSSNTAASSSIGSIQALW
uniref:Ig-like domain-containing protein n=1 Tax=Poecilia mexicana TaxID=48701 RepID=A0A3B3WZM1_9TELE